MAQRIALLKHDWRLEIKMNGGMTFFRKDIARKYGVSKAILLFSIGELESYIESHPEEEEMPITEYLLQEAHPYYSLEGILKTLRGLVNLGLVDVIDVGEHGYNVALVKNVSYKQILN
jgi:hypothetical protein